MTVMYLLIVLYLNFFVPNIQENNATQILQKSEEQIQGIKSSYTEMIISVVRPKWTKEMTMKGWSIGDDYFSSVVLTPVKEKGTVFLKRENEVWNYVPSIERTIKLPPSMMMQNWMGTDFTNDDLVQRSSITDDYTNTIIGEETINLFVPTTPNPTSGFFVLIPKKDAFELDISVEDAFKLVISAGVVTPNSVKIKDKK